MTGAAHLASVVLVAVGTAVIVGATLGALAAKGPFARLHFGAPITALGAPLVGVGIAVRTGASLTTASVLLPIALLFATGPILTSAIARALAERDRTIPTGPQEEGGAAQERAGRPAGCRPSPGGRAL